MTQRAPGARPATAQIAGLQRLRTNRVRPLRDISVTDVLDSELRRVKQVQRAAVSASNAWDTLLTSAGLPPDIAARTRVVSFRSSILTIRVSDASTKYALDRFLRSGGEAALARLTSSPLRRVKLVM